MSEDTKMNFSSFVISYVSLSVIAGLFSFRLLNSFLDNIVLPLLDLSLLPDRKFHKLTKTYDHKKNEIPSGFEDNKYTYVVRPGFFIKELIIWCFMMITLYFLYKISKK